MGAGAGLSSNKLSGRGAGWMGAGRKSTCSPEFLEGRKGAGTDLNPVAKRRGASLWTGADRWQDRFLCFDTGASQELDFVILCRLVMQIYLRELSERGLVFDVCGVQNFALGVFIVLREGILV